jgi:hypothetical protein
MIETRLAGYKDDRKRAAANGNAVQGSMTATARAEVQRNVLSQLALLGFSGVTIRHLSKLEAADEYQTELEAMAHVAANHRVSIGVMFALREAARLTSESSFRSLTRSVKHAV